MGFPAIFTLIVVLLMLIALASEFISSDFVMFFALSALLFAGIIDLGDAFSGFSNKGMLTVAVLFIVSKAVENTGALNYFADKFLSKKKELGISRLMLRMMIPSSIVSAFLNNTPIVVMIAPAIERWAKNLGLSPSKFLIPLSYATIFGGMITLIGTSTNPVVHGLMLDYGLNGIGMFELAVVGIPCAVIGWLYMITIGKHLLPDRRTILDTVSENKKEYMIELIVQKNSSFIGKTIRNTGVLNLEKLYSVEIIRNGKPVETNFDETTIKERDRLIFFGEVSAILEVSKIPNLIPDNFNKSAKDFDELSQHLTEVVISMSSPFLGKRIKECEFDKLYGAMVVAIHRNGEKLKARLRNMRLRAGDSLLLLTSGDFDEKWGDSQDFYLTSFVTPVFQSKANKIIGVSIILFLMVMIPAFSDFLPRLGSEKIDMLHTAVAAAILLVLFRYIKIDQARSSISFNVIVTIACALGISRALQNTGAAEFVASSIINIFSNFGEIGILAGIYIITMIFTAVITNNAAAALMCPIALSTANQLGVNPQPFFITIALAASASFATPIGYQTNIIVQGAGGYKFRDYLKVGLPLNLIFFILSILLIPIFWKF